jgi:hypothetical protein
MTRRECEECRKQKQLGLQTKLKVNELGDIYEQEADRIADQVLAMPSHSSVRGTPPRIQRYSGELIEQTNAVPASVDHALASPGRVLEQALRQDMEQRFGYDFSQVQVHSDAVAEKSALDVNAHAYTLGHDIVFAVGRYAPGMHEGRRLLAHELVHVIQQTAGAVAAAQLSNTHPAFGTASARPAIVQRQPRDPKEAAEPKSKPPAPATGPSQQLYAVRDKGLQLGGVLVQDLEEFKRKVMSTKIETDWTLVLAIHGSEDRLGAQAPPDWQKDAKFYEAAKIEQLFNKDKDFVKWRDRYGPTGLSLVACQVSASFEGTLIANLTRAGAGHQRQPARGLGAGCKPIATAQKLLDAPATRAGFDKLPATKRQSIIEKLEALNTKWGYYGAPPVPEDQILHYYYDEEPNGEWVQVEVMVGKEHDVAKLRKTGIPFWNRTFGPDAAEFRKLCSQGVGELKREHTPAVPPVKD